MTAEGLNLSPLFQIIFCLEVSSEISHYLSFRVSARHEICCPPAWPALGLTSKLPHSDSHSSWLQNHPAQDLGSQPLLTALTVSLTHGCFSLLTRTCSHTAAHLCQTRQLVQSSQRQIVHLRKGIFPSSPLLRLLTPVTWLWVSLVENLKILILICGFKKPQSVFWAFFLLLKGNHIYWNTYKTQGVNSI